MTCIAGFVDKNQNIFMGSDSLGSNSRIKRVELNSKIIIKKDIILGSTGSWRLLQLLEYVWTIPERKDFASDLEYMSIAIPKSMQQTFEEYHWLNNDDKEYKFEAALIGYNGVLYHMYEGYDVMVHSENYSACGIGADFALASFYTLDQIGLLDVPEKIHSNMQVVLAASAKFSLYVGPPFVIKELKFNKKNE